MRTPLLANVLVRTESMSYDEWLKYRRKGIGGSDLAAICSLSKWRRPIHVYLEKIGKAPPEEPNEAAEWGTRLEPLIAEKFASNHSDFAILEQKVIYSHPLHDWALGNLDRLIICPKRGRGILEIKTASEFLRHEWDNGNIPDYYYVQLQWYFFITGLNWGYFATLIGGNKYREYEVMRDQEMIDQLFRLASDFWFQHVMARHSPPFDGSDACTTLLHRLHPQAKMTTPIQLEQSDLFGRYFDKKRQIQVLEEEVTEIENHFKSILGDYELGIVGNVKVKWENRTRTSLDSKRLKDRYPDIYQECVKFSQYRQFSIKQEE
ncbi:YqaJ viral recombinase family protein [Brevibacillus agri]|uniref:YqaJ viral recombinase family nuclease n=1 Tax=Brevibacillus agri TaxID=51101 RepID=UPI0018CEA0F0|nr:YqaJ viral recombinase family protein [Brevibacillus agri]MBG9564133.1 hypothetical protein [Brevibacillus agri]